MMVRSVVNRGNASRESFGFRPGAVMGAALIAGSLIASCTKYEVRNFEAYGKLSVDQVTASDHNWLVTIRARGYELPVGTSLYQQDYRLKIIRSTLDCPTATIVDEEAIPRGTIGSKQQFDFVAKVKC